MYRTFLLLITVTLLLAFSIAPGGPARAQTTPPKINVKLVLAGQRVYQGRAYRTAPLDPLAGQHQFHIDLGRRCLRPRNVARCD